MFGVAITKDAIVSLAIILLGRVGAVKQQEIHQSITDMCQVF